MEIGRVGFWYSTADRPDHASGILRYEIVGSMAYPVEGHPASAMDTPPWFQV
jgi:hypothetical protein